MKILTDEEWIERRREASRRYRLKNKDKIRERNRQYRLENPDKIKERNRRNRLKNPDYNRRYYLKHKPEIRERNRQYRLENPMTMTKGEIEALEAKIARLKAKPLEELIYKRA